MGVQKGEGNVERKSGGQGKIRRHGIRGRGAQGLEGEEEKRGKVREGEWMGEEKKGEKVGEKGNGEDGA